MIYQVNNTLGQTHCIRCADGCFCTEADPTHCTRCVVYNSIQYYLNKTTQLCVTVCQVDPGSSKQYYKDMQDPVSPSCN